MTRLIGRVLSLFLQIIQNSMKEIKTAKSQLDLPKAKELQLNLTTLNLITAVEKTILKLETVPLQIQSVYFL